MEEFIDSDRSSVMSMGSDIDVPEDPVQEPVYLDKKNTRQLYKIIVQRGEGYDKPGTIDKVTIQLIENLREELPSPQQIQLGAGKLVNGLERAIITMKKDEVAQVYIPQEYGQGVRRVYKVKLLEWTSIHDLHADGKLVKIIHSRGTGFDRVSYKDQVILNVRIRNNTHLLLDNKNWEVIVDREKMFVGLIDILKSMKLNQSATIQVREDYTEVNFPYQGNLDVQVEVLGLIKLQDLNHDETFFKKTIRSGEGKDIPNSNARLVIRYKLETQEVYLDNFQSQGEFFIIDSQDLPTIWTTCLKQMKIGDIFRVEANLQGYSAFQISDSLNPKFNLKTYQNEGKTAWLTLEMINFDMGKVSYNMTLQERCQEAIRIKEVASNLFRKQYYDRAVHKYQAANVCLQPMNDDPSLLRPLHLQLMSNISLCYLKTNNYSKAEQYATKVIEIHPHDVKALLRRGIARRMVSNYDGAFQDLKLAEESCIQSQIENQLKLVQSELSVLVRLIQKYKAKEKVLYKNMFRDQQQMEVKVVTRAGRSLGTFNLPENITVKQFKQIFFQKCKSQAVRHWTVDRQKFSLQSGESLSDQNSELRNQLDQSGVLVFRDLGLQLSWRLVYVIEYLGPIVILPLMHQFPKLFYRSNAPRSSHQTLCTALAVIHFVKRELQSLFVHRFSNQTMPFKNLFTNCGYYWLLNGGLIGYSLLHPNYKTPQYSTRAKTFLVGGFALSEFLNGACHMILRNLRKPGTKERGIPKGYGFGLVSCANYFWEVCAWGCFAGLSRCSTSYLFLIATIVILSKWSMVRHKRYLKEFNGEDGKPNYPRNRKALFPFIY